MTTPSNPTSSERVTPQPTTEQSTKMSPHPLKHTTTTASHGPQHLHNGTSMVPSSEPSTTAMPSLLVERTTRRLPCVLRWATGLDVPALLLRATPRLREHVNGPAVRERSPTPLVTPCSSPTSPSMTLAVEATTHTLTCPATGRASRRVENVEPPAPAPALARPLQAAARARPPPLLLRL